MDIASLATSSVQLEKKLVWLDTEIRKSLLVDNQDHKRCIKLLNELETMQLTPIMLQKYPRIICTIKQVLKHMS